jgi:pimeloyl-ACP methyl ester carboxylesterase
MSAHPHWFLSLQLSDVRGLADVVVRSTRDVTAVVEGVHRSIHATLGLPGAAHSGRTAGITGLVYRSIDGIMQLTGAGLGTSLALAETLAPRPKRAPLDSRERDALLGVVNGILGDRLVAAHNPLALPMTLRHEGQVIDPDALDSAHGLGGRILVMIHGLCMTEHGWGRLNGQTVPDLGETLAAELGLTPIYVRYNSGQAVTVNGLELAERLEALLAAWPVPVTELTLLGHSMGGLVARSAVDQGQWLGHDWTRLLDNLVFLGTPHFGAPLERAGALLDTLLHTTPYTRPFTLLSRSRSRGIQDLRHGNLGPVNQDHDASSGHSLSSAGRRPCPLPSGVSVLAIAGTRANHERLQRAGSRARNLEGDGLVPVTSALGIHADVEHDLGLPDSCRVVLPATNHMELLASPDTIREVSAWLSPTSPGTR